MDNLYNVLGVAKDATQAEIKKAYRDLSKIHHPDKGGVKEEFDAINEAYQVLSDPDKRAHYDKTGTIKKKDNNISFFMGAIESVFMPLVYKYAEEQHVNLLEKFTSQLQSEIDTGEESLMKIDNDINVLNKQRGRISTTDEQNIITQFMDSKIESLKNQKANFEHQMEKLQWCIDFIENYECEVTERIGEEEQMSERWGSVFDHGNIRFR